MRILIVNYEFPPLGGGAAKASAEIARNLIDLGFSVTVWTSAKPGDGLTIQNDGGLKVIRIPCGRKQIHRGRLVEMFSFIRQSRKQMLRLLAADKFDCVLSFFGVPSGWVGRQIANTMNCPHVISLRGMDVPGFDKNHLALLHWLLRKPILKLWQQSNNLIANCQSLRDRALQFAGNARIPRIEIIGNGIDVDRQAQSETTAELNPTPLCLCVGRMVEQKGHRILIDALADPVFQQVPWKLVLIGDGPKRFDLERRVNRLQLNQRIEFWGWQSPEELQEVYRRAQILFHPSLDEGMSNVLLEGLAHGLLVVASRAGGNSELIQANRNGLLTENHSMASLRRGIRRAFDLYFNQPKALAALRQEAQSSVQNRTWEAISKNFAEVLKKVGETQVHPQGPANFEAISRSV